MIDCKNFNRQFEMVSEYLRSIFKYMQPQLQITSTNDDHLPFAYRTIFSSSWTLDVN